MLVSLIKMTCVLSLCIAYLFYVTIQLTCIFHLSQFNFTYYCSKSKLIYYMILSLVLNTFSILAIQNYMKDYNKIKYNHKNKDLLKVFGIINISNIILFLFGINEIITNIIECNIKINYRDWVYVNLCFQLIIIFIVSLASLLMFNKLYLHKYEFFDSKYYV